jgi:diaminopimelate epimerase
VLLKSKNRIMKIQLKSGKLVSVDMGAPTFEPKAIPFIADSAKTTHSVDLNGQCFEIATVSMGNPHAVIRVDDINTAAVEQLGPQLQAHRQFPESVNVGFMEIVDPQHIRLRVYERGAGETQACGSGACAAAVVAIQQELVKNSVKIELLGGELSIEWRGNSQPVLMTGPAETVFHGQIKI